MKSIEAEKSAIGAALISAEAYARLTAELIDDDFTQQSHKTIFSAIKRMYEDGKPLDAITLMDALGRDLEAVGGAPYITELSLTVPSAANIEYYIGILREAGRKRRLLIDLERICTGIQSDDPDVDYLKQTEDAISNAYSRSGYRPELVKDLVLPAYQELFEGKKQGMSTGFLLLDQTMGGLKRGHVCIVAGRPSMGKTSFATNIAAYAARADKTIAFFTLEQPRIDIVKRLLISSSGCSEVDAQANNLEQLDKLVKSMDDANKWRLCVVDSAYTVDQIREQSYAIKRTLKSLDLVVIDYLQLIKTRGRKNGTREQEVSDLSRAIKLLARELDVPIILLSQLSRATEQRADHRPILADLRESGAIEQDADEVVFLYRPYVYDKKTDPRQASIIVAKNRNGDIGEIEAEWDGEHFRYTDIIMTEVNELKWEDI